MLRQRFTGLWRHADFIRVWIGQTVSVFGSLIGGPALAFTAILILHATPFQLGVLAAARLAPGVLTGLFAGAWADRLRRRPIMIGADIGRAMLLAIIPLAAILGLLRIQQFYVVTFLVGVLTVLFDVAYQSYLPSLIAREDLVEGNSKVSASASVAEVSGLALAGWLAAANRPLVEVGARVAALSNRIVIVCQVNCRTHPNDLAKLSSSGRLGF